MMQRILYVHSDHHLFDEPISHTEDSQTISQKISALFFPAADIFRFGATVQRPLLTGAEDSWA